MAVNDIAHQYLTFKLAAERYGLDVLQVREVLELPKITRVPRMPRAMKGVINIRGSVVPVVDLRLKLGLEEAERTVHTRVVIIEVQAGSETIVLGILVDAVHEVVEIPAGGISQPPQIGSSIDAAYISGIATIDSGFAIIIDIARVFDARDLGVSDEPAEDQAPAEA